MKLRAERPVRHLPLAVLLAIVGLIGCAKPSAYKAPVGKFRDASTVVIQSTKVYLTQLNKVERDQYIYSQVVSARNRNSGTSKNKCRRFREGYSNCEEAVDYATVAEK